MLELQRILEQYRSDGHDGADVPVFEEASFRLGKYRDGSLLKFRGIIRDVLDPELVLLSDALTNGEDAAADAASLHRVMASADDLGQKFVERVPLKVAVVPHVTDWAATRYQGRDASGPAEATTSEEERVHTQGKGTKRQNNDIADVSATEDATMESVDAAAKKPKAGSEDQAAAGDPNVSAFAEPVVSIYAYDGQYAGVSVDAFKVNEAFEFIGVLDLAVMSSGRRTDVQYDDGFSEQAIQELTISDCLEGIQRKQQSSIVLHCCDILKLEGIHAVQPHKSRAQYAQTQHSNAERKQFLVDEWTALGQSNDIFEVRKTLVSHLARAVGGDELAAEYVLLCLLAKVYSRPDATTALGNLSVNLGFSTSTTSGSIDKCVVSLTAALASIVPMLATIDMSIESLNKTKFAPHKDYDQDMLCGGVLQFAHGTTVLVNETVLSTGNLNEQGVKNVGALHSLIEKMLLPYDFQYYSMDFPQDVVVLSISQGKSILPMHVSVPVVAGDCNENAAVIAPDALVESFRLFVAVLRSWNIRLGNEQADIAEKHYVSCRRAKQDVSIEDLHRWLRLARLLALSLGEEEVSARSWEAMLALEQRRIDRVDAAAGATNP